jgi:hypothetical protein
VSESSVEVVLGGNVLGETWLQLSLFDGGVEFRGKYYSKQECLINAVRYDDDNLSGWMNLGGTLKLNETVFVASTPVSRQYCYIKMMKIDDRFALGWSLL